MRHRKAGRKLGRTSAHRKALGRNLVASLFKHGRVKTTLPKAKEYRAFAEKLITLGKNGSLAARRRAESLLQEPRMVAKLFKEIAPAYKDRAGGYTRILKLSKPRLGDNAPTAILELVEEETTPRRKKRKKPSAPKAKGRKPAKAKEVEPVEEVEAVEEGGENEVVELEEADVEEAAKDEPADEAIEKAGGEDEK